MIDLYRYRIGDTLVCAASREAVVAAFGDEAEFERYFGGSMSFGLPSRPDYLGVWGARNASRFRRILRQAGFDFEVCANPPPAPHTLSGLSGERLTASQRLDRELTFRRIRAVISPATD